jgi:hypothetical protein
MKEASPFDLSLVAFYDRKMGLIEFFPFSKATELRPNIRSGRDVTEYQVLWVPYLGCGLKIIILLQ